MIKKKKILAIIPARGGSKRVPKKNIRFLAGKPLIVHTIDYALKSNYLDKVVVSTDDKDIADISKNAGAQIIQRPKELAEDASPTHPVIEHVINYLAEVEKYTPDIILLLQPTSPLRTTEDINNALEIFLKNKCESVVSISESGHIPNGAIYISTPTNLLKYESFYSGKVLPYIMPKDRSVDIDDEIDFKLTEILIKEL